MTTRIMVCQVKHNSPSMMCACPDCDKTVKSEDPRGDTPWDAVKRTINEFNRRYPHMTVGKIEVWDLAGTTSYKRKKSRATWRDEQSGK